MIESPFITQARREREQIARERFWLRMRWLLAGVLLGMLTGIKIAHL